MTGGDLDPGRGRQHRPDRLQLCLTCFDLRGPHGGFDNLCRCDRDAWDEDPVPRYGDLGNNVRLCKSCLTTTVDGASRWTPYHCRACLRAVQRWRDLARRSIVPIGPHSLMNGIGWRSSDGQPMTSAQATAFSDQLNALFSTQRALDELVTSRVRAAARSYGFEGHAVSVTDFVVARRAAGVDERAGFAELVAAYAVVDGQDEHADDGIADRIWRAAHTQVEPS